jgi:hypothetical protein
VTSRPRRLAVPLFAVALAVGACGTTETSPSDSLVPPTVVARTTSPIETPIDVTTTAVPSAPVEAGQTDTAWGRIWDSVPPGFPVYPESVLSEEAATGPASAVYVAPQADAAAVATWFQDHLEEAAYSTYALSGPLEDGSYVIDSIGQDDDCLTEVTIAPLGGTISVTVRYGAGCPHD